MSIDARVKTVHINEDGSGWLELEDRPAGPHGHVGIAGQPRLYFDSAPHEVTALNGRDIWGGSDLIVYDEQVIAVRIGYTRIKFTAEKFHGYATEPSIADVKRDLAEMCIDTTAAKAKVLAAVRETGK